MTLNIFKHRKILSNTLKAIEKGELTIGFIGGSITDSRGKNRWAEPVVAWFSKAYPNIRIYVENAAIGATGSDLAVFRAKRDLVERNCDLIFVEFAVNDNEQIAEKRFRTREGLIRKLLVNGKSDLVLTYAFMMDMYEDMFKGEVPQSIKDFEILAIHYNISSVWMGLYAFEQVKAGQVRWEEWIPDGLHPENRGSLIYGESVIELLTKELGKKHLEDRLYELPLAYNTNNWGEAYLLPFSEVNLEGPWIIRRWTTVEWMDQVIETSAVGACLAFSFTGRGLALGFDFGKTSAEFRYRIDGGEWKEEVRERPDWCLDEGWYRISCITDELSSTKHEFELQVIHGNRPECKGTNFRLSLIGIIP